MAHRSDVVKEISYAVILQSQLGPRNGELTLRESTEAVSGYLSMVGCRNGFSGTVLDEGKYMISGNLLSGEDREPYDAIFRIERGHLAGGLITRHGCWDLTGIRLKRPSRLKKEG